MVQLSGLHKTLAGCLSLLLVGGVVYLASKPSSESGTRLALSHPTDFGRPTTKSEPAAEQSSPTVAKKALEESQQEPVPAASMTTTGAAASTATTGAASSKMFGEPVHQQTGAPSSTEPPLTTTEMPVVAANQPVKIEEAKMSVLEPEPTSPPTTPAPTERVVETITTTTPSPTSSNELFPTQPPAEAAPQPPVQPEPAELAWREFKAAYRRQYPSVDEEIHRRQVFMANWRFIEGHNEQKDQTYKLGVNHFADMSRDEINHIFIGPQLGWNETLAGILAPSEPLDIMPDLNAKMKGADHRHLIAPPVDQAVCRDSAVFAAVASMEAYYNGANLAASNGEPQEPPVKLSYLQLLDCLDVNGSPHPPLQPTVCLGLMTMATVFNQLKQLSQTSGLASEAEYLSRTATSGEKCSLPPPTSGAPRAKLSDYNLIHPGNIPDALMNSGPLVVALDASQSSFHFYKSGLYHDQNCSTDSYNHHVLLVGYQPAAGGETIVDQDGQAAGHYLVRNSFGLNWGEAGHMRLLKVDTNKCLPQKMAIFPQFMI